MGLSIIADLKGKVKSFDNASGFGYVECPDYKDVYIHHSSIRCDCSKQLTQGQDLTFDLLVGSLGFQADNVRIDKT